MFGKIIGSGQLGKLASFASPAFFDVMPAKALWTRGRQMLSQSRDSEAFRHALAARAEDLAQNIPNIVLAETGATPGGIAGALSHSAQAALIVQLYFHQLFAGDTSLLDLRRSAFTERSGRLLWRPAPWSFDWSRDFIDPLREIYRGFYAHDDAQFRRGLAALSLTHTEDLFRQHFGGDQATVRFEMHQFVSTFHQVFLRCKARGTTLHPDFLPLGIYLAALYDHVQELGVSVDVALAFERAQVVPDAEAIHA